MNRLDRRAFLRYSPAEAFGAGLAVLYSRISHGLALAAQHQSCLILVDIQLPDIDGVTALGRLRADPRTAVIPVVALTAFAMKEDRERLLAAPFDAYLGKPIDVRTFPEQIRTFVQTGARPVTERIPGQRQ